MEASAAVLRADKELMLFPILSSIGVLIVTATFAFPMIAAGFFDNMVAGNSQVIIYIELFFFYVVQYTVIIFAYCWKKKPQEQLPPWGGLGFSKAT